MPPSGAYEWNESAGTSAWADGVNWAGGLVPSSEADVFFGNAPSGQPWEAKGITNALADRPLRSLWFDSSFDYTLSGASLWLGNTLEDGGRLITVLNTSGHRQGEVTFEGAVNVSTANPGRRFIIHNDSLGGLRFNGGFNTGGHSLSIEGGAGISFAGVISGVSGGGAAGEIRVNTGAGGGHVLFSADNSAWGGTVHVDSGMAVVTANGALGSASLATRVAAGATLAFRQQNQPFGPTVNYVSAKTLELVGEGIWRWGEGNVGALYNDVGNNTFAGAISLLGSNVAIGSRANWLYLSGAVSGNASLTKVGRGLVALGSAANSYTGATIIREGGLWFTNEAALQGGFGHATTGTNVVLEGGVLTLTTSGNSQDDFNRQIGTGAGQIQWTGSGGFAQAGGSGAYIRLINEDSVDAGTLTWGKGGFLPFGSALLFGTEYTTGIVSLRNSIDLAGGLREISVHRNTLGSIIGTFTNGSLLKTGQGRLSIRGDLNYTGPTVIREGVFEAPQYFNTVLTNFQLDGGTLALNPLNTGGNTTYEAHLGAGPNQVQWLAGRDGGLTMLNGTGGRLRINGSQAAITWGQQYFVGLGNTLILGYRDNTSTLIFDTALNLAGGERTIHVADSLVIVGGQMYTGAEVKFTQALSNGSLRLVGDGRADLAVANPNLGGTVTVNGAELRLNEGGILSGISALRAERGGTVTLDNSGTHNTTTGGWALADRVADTANVTLDAGTLRFWGNDVAGSAASETLSTVSLAGGLNTIDVVNHAGVSGSATLNLGSLVRSDPTATINFINSGGVGDYNDGSMTIGAKLRFATAPSLSGGILPYATVHGSHWATVTADRHLVAYSGYQTGAPSTWAAAHNVSITQDLLASGPLTINSLHFDGGSGWILNLQTPSTLLTLTSGGILSTSPGGVNARIQSGRLTTPADNLYIHAAGVQLNIGAEIFGNAGLVKAGSGVLLLHGDEANTYQGTTLVHDGILALQKLAGMDAISGDVIVGDYGHTAHLMLLNSHQIPDTATVTLRGVQHTHPTYENRFRQGVLQLNNGGVSPGIREAFDRLHIDGRGVIAFVGGEFAKANYLLLNHLSFADTSSRLIVQRWVQFEDYLLVRRSGNESLIPALLPQIIFDGYGPTRWVPYDNDHWQLTPFPEPSTYGAILGAVGLGLFAWRKKRRRPRAQTVSI